MSPKPVGSGGPVAGLKSRNTERFAGSSIPAAGLKSRNTGRQNTRWAAVWAHLGLKSSASGARRAGVLLSGNAGTRRR